MKIKKGGLLTIAVGRDGEYEAKIWDSDIKVVRTFNRITHSSLDRIYHLQFSHSVTYGYTFSQINGPMLHLRRKSVFLYKEYVDSVTGEKHFYRTDMDVEEPRAYTVRGMQVYAFPHYWSRWTCKRFFEQR